MKKLIIFVLSLAILCALLSISATASVEIANSENEDTEAGTEQTQNDSQESQMGSGASEGTNSEIIKEYLKEKILPVIIGVLTALCALLATLGKIKKAMCDLGASREELKKEAEIRDLSFKEKSEYIQARIDEVKETLKDVPALQQNAKKLMEEISMLKIECEALGKMLHLGFLQSKDVITSGAGKKIVQLAEEISRLNDSSISLNESDNLDKENQITTPCVDNLNNEGVILDDEA